MVMMVAGNGERRRRRVSQKRQAASKRDVHSGDDEEVEGAGALETETEGVAEDGRGRRRAWR